MELDHNLVADKIIWYSDYLYENTLKEEYRIINSGQICNIAYLMEVAYMQKHNGEPLFKADFEAWPNGPRFFDYFARPFTPNPKTKNTKLPTDVLATLITAVQVSGELYFEDLNEFLTTSDKPFQQAFQMGDYENNKPGKISKQMTYNFYKTQPLIFKSVTQFAKKKEAEYEEFYGGKPDLLSKILKHVIDESGIDDPTIDSDYNEDYEDEDELYDEE